MSDNTSNSTTNASSQDPRSADDNSRSIELLIKSLQQPTKSVCVPRNASVLELKNRIQVLFDVDSLRQRLIFQGRVMTDDKNLLDYENLGNGKVIHLVIRPLDAPRNPANDEPRQQSTDNNGQRARRLRSGYAVISVDASLVDLANGGNNLLSNLFSFPGLNSLPATPPSPASNSNRDNNNSTAPNAANNNNNNISSTASSNAGTPSTPTNRISFERLFQGLMPPSLRTPFSTSSSSNNNSTSNTTTATSSNNIPTRTRANDLRRAVEEGLSELMEGYNGVSRGTSTTDPRLIGRSMPTGRSVTDQQTTYENRLARTLAYLVEIRHLLDTPVVDDPEAERQIHEESRRNSLRTLEASRERMSHITDQRHRLALVVDEMATLLESTVPYLRNVAGILRQDDTIADNNNNNNNNNNSTDNSSSSDSNNTSESREDNNRAAAESQSSIFRAARIIQAVSLSNYFLGSLLAFNRNRLNNNRSSRSSSDFTAQRTDSAAEATAATSASRQPSEQPHNDSSDSPSNTSLNGTNKDSSRTDDIDESSKKRKRHSSDEGTSSSASKK